MPHVYGDTQIMGVLPENSYYAQRVLPGATVAHTDHAAYACVRIAISSAIATTVSVAIATAVSVATPIAVCIGVCIAAPNVAPTSPPHLAITVFFAVLQCSSL